MKQERIVQAYRVIMKLAGEQLPLPVSFGLYKLRKQLEPHFDFQVEQEQKYIETIGAQISPDGVIQFTNNQQRAQYVQRFHELSNMDVDIAVTPVTIDSGTVSISLSMNEIESLDGFVNIT